MEEQNKLELNELAMDSLRSSAKWCTFLSILGFIGIGFMLILSLFVGSFLSQIPQQESFGFNPFDKIKSFIGIFYALIAVIYFFPIYYLYKYATGMKNALNMRSTEMVAVALTYLKSHHKFLGIMAIVVISLYFLIFIGAIIFAATMASNMM